MEFVIKDHDSLQWGKNKWSKNVLNGLFSSVKDIYLDNVRFELNSAQLKEIGGKRFLYIVFQMIGANDLVLTSDAILLICPYTYLLRYKMICDKLIRSNIVFIFKLKFTMISKTKYSFFSCKSFIY